MGLAYEAVCEPQKPGQRFFLALRAKHLWCIRALNTVTPGAQPMEKCRWMRVRCAAGLHGTGALCSVCVAEHIVWFYLRVMHVCLAHTAET